VFTLTAINGYSRNLMMVDTAGLQSISIEQLDEKGLKKMDEKYSDLTKSLDEKSMKFLDQMEKKELRMRDRLMLKDSMAAKKLFADAQSKYEALRSKLQSPATGIVPRPLQEYIPRLDSLQTFMHFLSQPAGGGAGISGGKLQQLQALSSQLQQ
ncbi:MAG TPA: hypothetical protein VK518_15645, partial [Puia sp.]|nr:hypothetical protein [Puia sp.]